MRVPEGQVAVFPLQHGVEHRPATFKAIEQRGPATWARRRCCLSGGHSQGDRRDHGDQGARPSSAARAVTLFPRSQSGALGMKAPGKLCCRGAVASFRESGRGLQRWCDL